MFKKLFAFLAAMSMAAVFAAVDVNKASDAELDGVKGIGPVTTKLITAERKKGEFKNWDDLISRVKGVGGKTAAKLSANGLTVSGTSYAGPAAADVKKDVKKTDQTAAVSTKEGPKDTAKDVKAATTPKPEVKAAVTQPAASTAKK